MPPPVYDFGLGGHRVQACRLLGYQIDVTIDDGSWFSVESRCVVRLEHTDHELDPQLTVASPHLDRLPGLVGTVLSSALVDHTDTLVLTGDDGRGLVVPPHRDGYEAWSAGSRGTLVVSMGDGHLEFFGPPGGSR